MLHSRLLEDMLKLLNGLASIKLVVKRPTTQVIYTLMNLRHIWTISKKDKKMNASKPFLSTKLMKILLNR